MHRLRFALAATLVSTTLGAAAALAQVPTTSVLAGKKFTPPIKGEAIVEFTAPVTKREKEMVVTRVQVKNVSKGPIAGFKVDEYWYNAKGEAVSGAQTFRVLKPMMPGDIVEVVLKSPKTPDMARSQRVFGHANGTVKPTKVPAFKKDS